MYTFEVHAYAPELNKVFKNGVNISKLFSTTILLSLANDYYYNLQVIRKAFKTNKNLRTYKIIATRPSGTIETRFCSVYNIQDAIKQLRKAKRYYNIEGTKIEFKRIY